METNVCPNCGALIEEYKGIYGECSFCGTKIEKKNTENIEKDPTILFIPEGTALIKEHEFSNNRILKKVVLPSTIKIIGKSAFENCENLEELIINGELEEIDDCAFKNTGIQSLILPVSVKKLGKECFMNCHNLFEVTIESSNISITDSFKKCEKLEKVNVNFNLFYPSFIRSENVSNKRDYRPTYFDVFQATPFYFKLKSARDIFANRNGCCIFCNGPLTKKLFKYECNRCGMNLYE